MKRLTLIITLCLFTLVGICQNNDFVFFTDNSDKFTLYLNNVKQNTTAANNVKAVNISGKNIAVKVVFERSGVPTLNRTMNISDNNKEIKVQLIKGRQDVYSLKTVATSNRSNGNSNSTVVKGNGSTETKDHGNNGGHGNNNGHGNNHGNNGYPNGHPNGSPNGYPNSNQYGPTDNQRCHTPMNTNDFNSLANQIRYKSFDNSRLSIAKQACAYNCMTSDQICAICKLFSYENSKLEFAKYAYDFCYDRYRYYIVGQAFSYSSSVDELNRFIANHPINQPASPNGGYGNNGYPNGYGYIECDNPRCRYFMSEYDFNELRNMINNTPYSSTKMIIAKQACSSSCMSAEQIREICRLFTFDNSRLEFAKYAYDYCYDRRNYFKVNEVFTFASTIEELNRYINSHN